MADSDELTSNRETRKRAELGRILVREEIQARSKTITSILKKAEQERTNEELQFLEHSPELVLEVEKRIKKRLILRDRTKEIEDPPNVLLEKCRKLADAIRKAKFLVIYTGAGISTAASIPDYRGPNGVWTLLKQGKSIGSHELCDAEPTLTHMSIAQLYKEKRLAHVVSQNCDGLHLRSGLPRNAISEVHGNMYIEVCIKCRPAREYVRLFDVTERTSVHKHKTGRKCIKCNGDLIDTIVHFGEKGILKSPLNWSGAVKAAQKSDMILCLGSSLKVLRKYTCLWGMNRPPQNRPTLHIVNLQWTPKDHLATLKINGKCDEVMKQVMKHLKIRIPPYCQKNDPIFSMASPLRPSELKTLTRKQLQLVDTKKVEPQTKCSSPGSVGVSERLIFLDHTYAKCLSKCKSLVANGSTVKKGQASSVPESPKTEGSKTSQTNSTAFTKISGLPIKNEPVSPPHSDDSSSDLHCDSQELLTSIKTEHPGCSSSSDIVLSRSSDCSASNKCNKVNKFKNKTNSVVTRKGSLKESINSDESSAVEEDDSLSSSEDDEAKKKKLAPSTPGWFGKGYRKWQRKRRRL